MKEKDEFTNIKVKQCNGAAECKKALMLLKVGKLPEDFIEGMSCEGGCVNGPGSVRKENLAKRDRAKLLGQADDREIYQNIDTYVKKEFSMHRK